MIRHFCDRCTCEITDGNPGINNDDSAAYQGFDPEFPRTGKHDQINLIIQFGGVPEGTDKGAERVDLCLGCIIDLLITLDKRPKEAP